MTAREEVLRRIRSAIAPTGDRPRPVPRDYRTTAEYAPGSDDAIARFVDRLEDYGARVTHATEAELATVLVDVLADDHRVVLPAGSSIEWRAACTLGERDVVVDGRPATLSPAELDAIDAVVTACRVAVAETGTIVLDGSPDQGRRAITLVPDHHVAVVRTTQVVASVPEALARLEPTRPLTFISGPSATSDIEFDRVEGVHGPRRLDVVILSY